MPIMATHFARRPLRPAFTLVELLVVMGVLAMLSSMVLVGLSSAAEQARANRTRSQVQKIHELLMPRWDEYRYRRVEANKSGDVRARQGARVDKIRQLMRMEMPCHRQDVQFGLTNNAVAFGSETTEPALWRRYRRAVINRAGSFAAWSSDNDDAECLYMILESIQVGETNGLDFFKKSEIGDTDDDGMPEILDGWGNPIHFIRWAPGFIGPRSNLHHNDSPDPFDPLGVRNGRLQTAGTGIYDHFPLFPLIVSEGPDGALDIRVKYGTVALTEATINGSPPNNPYYENAGARLGDETDTNGNSVDEFFDNVSNHQLVIAGNSQ
ncbi:type II secretion system protein [Bremerella sp. P1]|uniref:type II secretion system protein n=1 Tax=Bremerella sp. P1 TaxID=3026424 RepID=UPI002367493D|nr:prepilin-type N-terminal cleavage/methylation domain-containing protein [Bremerella sp. P1]WDI40932.1 prepilin-type N-terminal cleavage/methylation domain-containing protein [Bremerella sp. P1]